MENLNEYLFARTKQFLCGILVGLEQIFTAIFGLFLGTVMKIAKGKNYEPGIYLTFSILSKKT